MISRPSKGTETVFAYGAKTPFIVFDSSPRLGSVRGAAVIQRLAQLAVLLFEALHIVGHDILEDERRAAGNGRIHLLGIFNELPICGA